MYFGPYTLPVHNCLTIACCGPSSDKTGNGATVQIGNGRARDDVQPLLLGLRQRSRRARTAAPGATRDRPASIADYSSYSFHEIVGYAQEIGHNFGMTHEPTMCCGGTVSGNRTCSGGATFSDNTTNCQHMEYANSLSFMGGGAHHPSAVHKYHQGWMSGCNLVKVGTSARRSRWCRRSSPATACSCCRSRRRRRGRVPGLAGDRQGIGADADALLPRDARAATGSTAASGRWCWCRSVPICRRRTARRPTSTCWTRIPSTTTLNDAGLRAGRELQRSGRRPHGHGQLDRQRRARTSPSRRPARAR